jgi:uncharacterized SAM-binding protein YcdF (DUF218 family)
MLLWFGALQLGAGVIPALRWVHFPLVAGGVGALLGVSRARVALWIAGGIACAGILVVSYTPFITPAVRGLVRADPLEPVEAVVVLSSSIQKDGDLDTPAQERVLHGYELLRQGYGRRLVLTQLSPPRKSYVPAVRRQMKQLGLDYEIDEAGPVANTRDEAVAVSRLAQVRGWRRVILVSEPTHMRRAAATFKKAGLTVLCSPCTERGYDLSSPEAPPERLAAFRDWLYEVIGYQMYRLRGWI